MKLRSRRQTASVTDPTQLMDLIVLSKPSLKTFKDRFFRTCKLSLNEE